jgi:ABC-type transport system substrate-binding protein
MRLGILLFFFVSLFSCTKTYKERHNPSQPPQKSTPHSTLPQESVFSTRIRSERPNAVIEAQFSPQGNRILTLSQDGSARLWDSQNGALIALLEDSPSTTTPPLPNTPSQHPLEEQILVFGRGGDSLTLDPAKATDGETFYATKQLYDTLVQFRYGTTEIEPALAERWDISKDGLLYTFYLRKGVSFQPTSYFPQEVPFTAEDVLFSLKRQLDENHPFHQAGEGVFEYWLSMGMSSIIKDLRALDSHTVQFELHQPEAPFLANLAMDFTAILCKKYAETLLSQNKIEHLNQFPVGTGAFLLKEWIKDDRMTFVANPHYWGGRSAIDKLILKVIPNNSTRAAELKAGQIHVMDFPNPEEVQELEKNPDLKIVRQEGLNVGYLAMNTEKAPFDQVLVRQAINLAINKKAIVKAIYAGFGVPAKNPIPPTIWSYHEGIEEYPYDPEAAKKLLTQAGFPEGFETDLWAMPVPRPYIPNARKVAEAIQADLLKIGVKLTIVSHDWGVYLEKTKYGEHSMALLGWTGDNGDPDNFLYVLLSSEAAQKPANNIAFFQNSQFDTLLKQAKRTADMAQRTLLYRQAQEIFHREAPWVPLAHSIVVEPMRKEVEGFKLDPTGSRRFHSVRLVK